MKREERLLAILDVLGEAGSVEIPQIIETFGVSAATARRDLDALASRKLLSRTRGGASAQPVSYDLPLRYKREQHAAEKARIAKAAQRLVEPGTRVGLSGGTTTTAIAAEFAVREDLIDAASQLIVVTNAINIASQLAIRPHLRVVVSGGVVHARSYELVGPYSDLTLQQVALDVAFLGVNGLDSTFGPTVHDEREARVNALMASRAELAWIVADSSKIGVRAFAKMGDPAWYAGLVTDSGIDPQQRRDLEGLGWQVIVA